MRFPGFVQIRAESSMCQFRAQLGYLHLCGETTLCKISAEESSCIIRFWDFRCCNLFGEKMYVMNVKTDENYGRNNFSFRSVVRHSAQWASVIAGIWSILDIRPRWGIRSMLDIWLILGIWSILDIWSLIDIQSLVDMQSIFDIWPGLGIWSDRYHIAVDRQ